MNEVGNFWELVECTPIYSTETRPSVSPGQGVVPRVVGNYAVFDISEGSISNVHYNRKKFYRDGGSFDVCAIAAFTPCSCGLKPYDLYTLGKICSKWRQLQGTAINSIYDIF